MPELAIPPSGIMLEGGEPSKSRPAAIIGLTLNDSVIEDMVKNIMMGKPLQLSLGNEPSISYGNMTQLLTTSHDPFATDIYQSTYLQTAPLEGPPQKPSGIKIGSSYMMFKSKKAPIIRTEQVKTTTAEQTRTGKAAAAPKKTVANKPVNNKPGTAPPAKRGTKKSLLNTPSFTGLNRSAPSSPSLTGVASAPSPRHAPTSTSSLTASEQQAEKNKFIRFPIIHTLAVQSATKEALWKVKKEEWTDTEFETNLDKVADKEGDKYVLRPKMFRDLDVHKYAYAEDEDRQKAIDNAVRAYDKQRINSSAPEWDRLLPKEERGTGRCLSQLQAKIATGTAKVPKISVQSAVDGATSGVDDSGAEGSVKDDAKRSTPVPKKQKPSAKEAQQKRLLGQGGITKSLPKQIKKTAKPKQNDKFLSSQYISNSDDDLSDVLTETATDTEQSSKKLNRVAPTSAPKSPAPSAVLKKSPLKKSVKPQSDAGSETPIQKKWMSAKQSVTNKVDTPKSGSTPVSSASARVPKNPVQRSGAVGGATPDSQTSRNPVKRSAENAADSPAPKKSKLESPMPQHATTTQKPSPATSSSFSNTTSDTTAYTRRPHKSSPLASSPPTNASDLEDNDNNSYISSSSTDKSKSSFVQQPMNVMKATSKFKIWYKQYQDEYKALEKLSATERELRKDDVLKLLAMHDKLKRIKEEILENYTAR